MDPNNTFGFLVCKTKLLALPSFGSNGGNVSLIHHEIVSLLELENEVCKIAEHGIDIELTLN